MIRNIIDILKITWKIIKKIEIIDLSNLQNYSSMNYDYLKSIKVWLDRVTDSQEGILIKIHNIFILINEEKGFKCFTNGPIIFSHPYGTPFIIDSFESPFGWGKKEWEDTYPKDIIKDFLDKKKVYEEIKEFEDKLYATSNESR